MKFVKSTDGESMAGWCAEGMGQQVIMNALCSHFPGPVVSAGAEDSGSESELESDSSESDHPLRLDIVGERVIAGGRQGLLRDLHLREQNYLSLFPPASTCQCSKICFIKNNPSPVLHALAVEIHARTELP